MGLHVTGNGAGEGRTREPLSFLGFPSLIEGQVRNRGMYSTNVYQGIPRSESGWGKKKSIITVFPFSKDQNLALAHPTLCLGCTRFLMLSKEAWEINTSLVVFFVLNHQKLQLLILEAVND